MATSINTKNLTSDEQLYLTAKVKYYAGEPILTDEDFDILEAQLEAIDSFVTSIVGSVTIVKNGFKVNKGKIKTVVHDTPMGSLDKVKFLSDYVPYNEFTSKFLSKYDKQTSIEAGPKLDGNAISMKYVDGKLIHVASRGDGIEGQDYTHLNLNIPKFIKGFTGEIRGEAVIETDLFDHKYGSKSDLEKPFVNARNFVAGTLSKGEKDRVGDIDIVAFQIVGYDGDETIKTLRKYGFETLDYIKTYQKYELTEAGFIEMYNAFDNYRKNCKYQLDGIVLKYPENIRESIGGNSHHPYWAIAVKFIPEVVQTKVIAIEWNLGKRGQLAPVAILEPVELMGSIVTRASLYNASWLLNENCTPGATVSLVKSGDIIPKIVEVLVKATDKYDLPTEFNDNDVTFNGVDLIVDGFENTPEYKALILGHTITALGIKGIGPATSAKISEAGLNIQTLLSENAQGLRTLLIKDGIFKDGRELDVLINNILDLTKVDLWEVIYSLGYINCGKTISKQLANYISNIKYDFKGLQKNVIEAFINDNNRTTEVEELVTIMRNSNIDVIVPVELSSDLITFEMSGDNESGETKNIYKLRIEQTNKALHTSLGKDTDYLVVGNLSSTTTKMQKAIKNGTKVVTYQEFENIINNL